MKSSRNTGSENENLGTENAPSNPGHVKHKTPDSPKQGTSRRDFLVTTAAGAGLLLAGRALGQEQPAAAAAAPAAEAAAPAAAAAAPAAAAPAAEAAAPAAAAAIVKTIHSADDLNIALIGLGAEGMVLMDAILRIPGVKFKAVCDIWNYSLTRGSRTLKKFGHPVNSYVDYRDLLNSEKDLHAVVVATPDFMHAEHSIACMKAGLHVYCEKEMSNSLEKAREMVLASRETGKLLQIGHQRRSNPRYIHAINRVVLENRLLGRVTHAYAQWNRAKSDDLTWPPKYEIEPAVLEKYGYDSMHHFRNWRWFKKYGGGPIVDLGSHQIDIFSWVFEAEPKAVMAAGGVDFYKTHEWYDNVLAIFDYEHNGEVSRAFYQVLTTTSNGGFYENFMGENGTLAISEVPPRGDHLLREAHAPEWEPYVKQGLLLNPPTAAPASSEKTKDVKVDTRVSKDLGRWPLPIKLDKPAHQPHLENFFNAIRIGTPLNCPAELGYRTAVAVLKVNQAVEAGMKLRFTPEEFEV